jgi:hypothetical protein
MGRRRSGRRTSTGTAEHSRVQRMHAGAGGVSCDARTAARGCWHMHACAAALLPRDTQRFRLSREPSCAPRAEKTLGLCRCSSHIFPLSPFFLRRVRLRLLAQRLRCDGGCAPRVRRRVARGRSVRPLSRRSPSSRWCTNTATVRATQVRMPPPARMQTCRRARRVLQAAPAVCVALHEQSARATGKHADCDAFGCALRLRAGRVSKQALSSPRTTRSQCRQHAARCERAQCLSCCAPKARADSALARWPRLSCCACSAHLAPALLRTLLLALPRWTLLHTTTAAAAVVAPCQSTTTTKWMSTFRLAWAQMQRHRCMSNGIVA